MTQNQLAELFATSRQNISKHVISIFDDNELEECSVVNFYLTTAKDGKKYEVDTLNRLVTVFLETAELRAKTRKSFTMNFWQESVDKILSSNEFPILEGKGAISKKEMEEKVTEVYQGFEERRKQEEATQADFEDMQELQKWEDEIKSKKL